MSLLARRDVLKSVLAWPLVGRLWPTVPVLTSPAPAIPAALPISLPAAEAYRKAFAWVETLTEADNALLAGGNTVPLGPAVDALLESARPALEAVRHGASQRECDWGIEVESVSMSQLAPVPLRMYPIVYALCLRARRSAESGRWDAFADDLFDGFAYAQHEGAIGMMVLAMFQQCSVGPAIELLAEYLPRLPRRVLEALPARFDRLPPPPTWRERLDAEYRFELSHFPENYPEPGSAEREAFDASVEKLAAILEQPPGLARCKALNAWQAASPPGTMATPLCLCVLSNREILEQAEAIRALLDAAIVRVRDGQEAFLAIRDPFSTGPFACEPRGEGFVLRSAFQGHAGLKTELRVGAA